MRNGVGVARLEIRDIGQGSSAKQTLKAENKASAAVKRARVGCDLREVERCSRVIAAHGRGEVACVQERWNSWC